MFTRPVGDSRLPSAVTEFSTVLQQIYSENHTSSKWPNHFPIRFPLINQCWVRLRGDAHKKNATRILASSTKTKNSSASIFHSDELHPLCL